jgi:hypothetical protein
LQALHDAISKVWSIGERSAARAERTRTSRRIASTKPCIVVSLVSSSYFQLLSSLPTWIPRSFEMSMGAMLLFQMGVSAKTVKILCQSVTLPQ